ncbi:MAG TPA: BadF/BadG/BcrA/BcrD ATPase family protein [Gaiellaceae bacterium]
MSGLILAVDGGNAKTDLALVATDGRVHAFVRGPGSSPHEHGVDGALDRIEALLIEAGADGPVAYAELLLAGVDFPSEVETVQTRARERGWADRVEVANDTFAVLRAGTDRGWGIALVCGAGINCLGIGPDGRQARFPALGPITGDWGGGQDVGLAAVFAAARSEDGRGPRTALEQAVPAHFGVATPLELAEAVHTGAISQRRFVELAPIVLAEAADDAVAAEIVDRLAEEVVTLVRVALERIGPVNDADIVLGGGLMQARDARLLAAIEGGLGELGILHSLTVVDAPPVVGAALRALDTLGAAPQAYARLRSELAAYDQLAEVAHG